MPIKIVINKTTSLIVDDEVNNKCSLSSLMKCTLFRDIINEFENIEEIPITYESTEIARNYLIEAYNDFTTSADELCEYLKFAQFVGDEENISYLSKRIGSNISQLNLDRNLTPEIEYAILDELPKISIVEYLFYKNPKIRKRIDWNVLSNCCNFNDITKSFIKNHINKFVEIYLDDVNITIDTMEEYTNISNNSWTKLSRNRGITQEFIEKYIDKPWNWGHHGLSTNPIITPDFIEKHSDKPWCWGKNGLSSNPSITLEFIEKHIDENWEWAMLSRHHFITIEFVEKYIHKRWEWGSYGLSKCLNITVDFVERHSDNFWSWETVGLSSNPSIAILELIEKYPNKPWNWVILSSNPIITSEFVEKYKDESWRWGEYGLSINPSITPNFVEKHPELPWCWGKNGLSSNPSITLEFIENNIDEKWDWGKDGLSSNPVITCDFVEKYKQEEWDWTNNGLPNNPSITIKDLCRLMDDNIDKVVYSICKTDSIDFISKQYVFASLNQYVKFIKARDEYKYYSNKLDNISF